MNSGINSLSLILAEQVSAQALELAKTLALLYLRRKELDGVTALRRALTLLPQTPYTPGLPGLDEIKISQSTSGPIFSTYLTNEQASSVCFRLRAQLAGSRPLGAEIIHKSAHAQSQFEETMRQVLATDWSVEAWDKKLMAAIDRYRLFLLTFKTSSSSFARADEDQPELFRVLLRQTLIPECLTVASMLVRPNLPNIVSAKDILLAKASKELKEFERLWSLAKMPLFQFAVCKSFAQLGEATRQLLQSDSVSDVVDLRELVPDILESLRAKATLGAPLLGALGGKKVADHYGVDDFNAVPEFAEVTQYVANTGNLGGLSGLDSLLMLSFAELTYPVKLIQRDLIEVALEQEDSGLSGSVSAFFSALTFASTKLTHARQHLSSRRLGD